MKAQEVFEAVGESGYFVYEKKPKQCDRIVSACV